MEVHNLGKTIADLRKSKGLTQVELANQLKISDKTVSKWESGAGYPEITMLPVIANLFGVSIDFLMTGKVLQPEIITMSKAELCAKNDDITLLNDVKIYHKDENNKNLIDYIKQYECLKVFVALCEKNKDAILNFEILHALKLCIVANRMDLLTGVKSRFYQFQDPKAIMNLLPVEASKHFRNTKDEYFCILTDDFFNMVVTDKRINESTVNFLLGKQNGRECVWYHAFPYLIHACYENGNTELLDRLLKLSEENNQYAYDNIRFKHDYYSGLNYKAHYFFIATPGMREVQGGHGMVRILDKTLKIALERGDIAMIERMNSININILKHYKQYASHAFECGLISDDEIRVAKLKLDKSISQQEIIVQSAIHEGILCIDELLAVKDYNKISEALLKYPVSKFEQLFHELEKIKTSICSDDWRYAFEYAVEHNEHTLMQALAEGNLVAVNNWLKQKESLPLFSGSVQQFIYQEEKNNPNGKYFCLRSKYAENSRSIDRQSLHGFVKHLQLCKQQVLDDLKGEYDTDSIVAEISEDFLRKELAKGNTELVVIKLCVRLEAVLKNRYHYEGDFSEMLEKYCKNVGEYEEDDGWGYTERRESEFVGYLQNLRKYRNSIVHSDKTGKPMKKEEIEYCIKYICDMK